ncbi:hypothetical protein QFZ81_000949 [Paenibacillus sp. V4I9]|uniref:hypothetical protein n=1 Tax=Paenibacillus sp. V4I9 TaxID=3042308 RepID=UPI00278B3FED|nr:hypothetical protein [Paenibacillus sp. V4I9]MDQ0885861.1 hypothetical protein [Paenibacillus sp. V4I9]
MFLIALTLTGCTQSSVASKANEDPDSSTIVSTPTSTPDLSSTNTKNNLEPASSTKPSIDPFAWIGKWKWDQSTQYDVSTITINNIKDQQVFFSLNAFHVTNHETMDGHNGVIENKIAVFNGNEAVYKDDEYNFELRISFQKDHLEVKTNNSNILGANVFVDGLYNRDQTHSVINNDYLIIPGKSVGKISLGMTKDDVIKLLGNPTNTLDNQLIYKSTKNFLSLYLKSSVVKQIEFTSPSFSTKDGVNTGNFENNHDHFTELEFQWRFLQLRFDWDQGGLSFFTFNADVPDDNKEYQRYTRGYIYEGQHMYEEPISDVRWKPVQ